MSCRDSGDVSRQAGDRFPRAMGGGIGDHAGRDTVSPCRAAGLDPTTHALPRATFDDGVDPMKTGESIRPIVLY
ncbi:hypothetical protein [Burkholderia sp. BCC1977]|uniref:hypothetical protein n=1 Tax=Burkholderia sp. BCC1977 TaxID=2817440 RepID=UPI002ABD52B0|nr:hypothetical protein [Burkholderia sp. BCC1977]